MTAPRKARCPRVPLRVPEFPESGLPIFVTFVLSITMLLVRTTAPLPPEPSSAVGSCVLFREAFDSLDDWEPMTLPKVNRSSRYEIVGGVLRASSDDSASGLVWSRRFDPHLFPRLSWRWKVQNVYERGDARRKKGDDYPLRIYVLFEYDPSDFGFLERLKYESARVAGGEYPPVGVVHYMWASREHEAEILPNPYAARCRMFPLREGDADTGRWVHEEVDVLADWRRAFGDRPAPRSATLAIMNDSDDTSESSVAFLDDLVIFRP